MDLSSQANTFFITVAMGIILGMIFDSYRVMRGLVRPGFLVTSLADLFFWLVATGIVFIGLLIGNWGEIRLYVFLGLLLGGLLYFQLLSRWFIHAFVRIVRLAGWIVRTVMAILHWCFRPLHWLAALAAKPVRFFVRKIRDLKPPSHSDPPAN